MAFDERLAALIRRALLREKGVGEIRMFGGLCFTVGGHMTCGLAGTELMVSVGPDAYASALRQPHARPMDFTGRPLKGFVFVKPQGLRTARSLARWVRLGVSFARSLPPKTARAVRPITAARSPSGRKAAPRPRRGPTRGV